MNPNTPAPHEETDAALCARALGGDQRAYGALLARHRDAIYRLVRAHIQDADEALDVTQESFIAAFAALERYDIARPLRLWLARIALNKCRDWGRRRAVRRFFRLAQPLEAAQHIASDAPDPEAALLAQREQQALLAAIDQLGAPLKEVLILRTIEGLSQQETAEILKTTEKTVETRLYRARQKLAEIMRD